MLELPPKLMLTAYAQGVFPMAESRDDPEIFWVDPELRGVMPLEGFHISRSLRKRLNKKDYSITINTAFERVIEACANRDETWINDIIFDAYRQLFPLHHAHSLEVWRGADLIGGIYGISLRGAFFGESMFSNATDGSKVAMAYLVAHLKAAGFTLFDTQFLTDHLASLGAVEIPRHVYKDKLRDALAVEVNFPRQLLPGCVP